MSWVAGYHNGLLRVGGVALVFGLTACSGDARTPGCVSNDECKSPRTCVDGQCVDPVPMDLGASGGAEPPGGGAGGNGADNQAGSEAATAGQGDDSGAGACVAPAGSAGESDPVLRFLGTWREAATSSIACADGSSASADVSGSAVIARGTGSDLVRTASSPGVVQCSIALDIDSDGLTARLASTAACDLNGISLKFDDWTMTVDAAGSSGTVKGSASAVQGIDVCFFDISGTVTKTADATSCTAETDAAFCARFDSCGCVTDFDNCGHSRTIDCGGSGAVRCQGAQPQTCDGRVWQASGPACFDACVVDGVGFNCACPDGYEGDGVGPDGCTDIDECAKGIDECDDDPAATCVNTTGSYACTCPMKSSGTGVGPMGCELNECAAGVDDCDTDPPATCNDVPGGYECTCPAGYSGTGHGSSGCMDVDECSTGGCDDAPAATCTNEVGTFSCECSASYVGDGVGPAGCNWPVESVAVGEQHVCALLSDHSVRCWGYNASGRLGLGDAQSRGDQPDELGDNLPEVNVGTGRTAKVIAPGSHHTCALLDNDTVKCWGFNTDGQLGLGDTDDRGSASGEMGDALPAVDLGTGRTAKAIAAGGYHTCAVLDDGSVKCWGHNVNGQLGLGDVAARGDASGEMGDALPTVNLGTGRTARAVTAGQYHTCALLDDATVKCWGYNINGELGQGDEATRGDQPDEMGDALPSIQLGTGRTVKLVAAGAAYTCAVLDDDTIKCWGYNGNGRLGLGNLAARGDQASEMGDTLPTVNLGTNRSARAIACGVAHVCALLDDSSLKCWGANSNGQLGQGDTQTRGDQVGQLGDSLPAVDLGSSRSVRVIAAGGSLSCALLDDATVKCWGYGFNGQLGQGDPLNRGDGPDEMGDDLGFVRLGGL